MIALDRLAAPAIALQNGVAHVQDTLGVTLATGGGHPHNRLLSLGPHVYPEVIAINPGAPRPRRPRWFDLDDFTGACPADQLDCTNRRSKPCIGSCTAGVQHTNGPQPWRSWLVHGVPDDGKLPFDGGFPALIEWQGNAHPAAHLPDQGCRPVSLDITHPTRTACTTPCAR